MRVCVFGAGAVGGYLAARLAHAGRHEVSLITRGAHLDAIRRHGLKLVTPDETFVAAPRAAADPAELGAQDLVIVSAKAPALPAIARTIGPLLGPDTPVAFAMNGVFWWYGHGFAPHGRPLDLRRLDPDGSLHREIGPKRALGMVVYSPNEVVEPGVVHNGGRANRFALGDPEDPNSARVRAAAEALSGAGFGVEVVGDIRREMWRKLVRNLSAAPICALTGARSREAVEDPATREVSRALIREAIAVAAGHGFDDLGVDPEGLTTPGNRPLHKPSMLQDLERGRPMEIDAMLGVVADFAAAAAAGGVPTPTLDTVLALLILRARTAGVYGREPL